MKTERPLFRWLGLALLTVSGLAGVSVADATWAKAGWVFLAVLVAAAVWQATASKSN